MSNFEQLKEKISSITEIYIGVKENFRFCYHLHHSDSEEEREYLSIDAHLQFIRHSLWRLTVIELCKLYSTRRNDTYDLQKLIKSVNGGNFGKVGIEPRMFSEWKTYLEIKQKVIKDLNNLRDKIYAHTAPNRDIYKGVDVYFQDVKELLDFAKKIIDEISVKINEPVLRFDSPYFERHDFELVRILAENHLLKVNNIQN